MTQDKFGFLWIGTRDGLNRFDGHSFEQFRFNNKDTSALAFTQIHSIHAMPNGNLIVGSVGGISFFNKDNATFHNVFFPGNDMRDAIVTSLSADSAIVHIATTRGILTFDILRKTFYADEDYQRFRGLSITHVNTSKTHGEWIGTTKGLYRKLPGEKDFTLFFSDTLVNNLTIAAAEVFVSTNRGVFHYRSGYPAFNRIHLGQGFNNVLSALRASNGEIWVACNRVLILSPDGLNVKHILSNHDNNYRSLSEDRARILYETRDSVMWIGTFGYGLNKHDPRVRRIDYFGPGGNLRLSSAYVSAVYSANDTVIFVGTSRGVNMIDLQKQTTTVFDPYSGSVPERLFLVYALKEDRSGVLWMSGSGGLYAWRGNDFSPIVKLSEIVDFVEFGPDALLLITRISGCYLFDKKTKMLSEFITAKDLPSDLQTARVDGNTIWIGANDGLRRFNRQGTLERHFIANPNDSTALPSNFIKSLSEDAHGVLWIGTWGGGLSKYDSASEKFKTITMNDGLGSNVIYGIVADEAGFLWLPTNNGVSAFNPANGQLNSFDVRDGLQSNEFNTGAYFESQYGRIYFGGVNGLNSFNPSETLAPVEIVNAQLTGVTLEHGQGRMTKPMFGHSCNIGLKWYENSVTLHLAVVDFRNAHKYKLQYAVNAEPWKDLGTARRVDLTGLGPGEYVVRTRTSIDNQSWTDGAHLITIAVHPPFWKHPLAIFAMIGALVTIVYLGQRVRVRGLAKRNELLDKLIQSRTREVQQKNEEIAAQNEELQRQSNELAQKNDLLEQHRVELEEFQKELEQRVHDRTRDIQNLNARLIRQNVQLEQFSFITAHNFKGPIARIKGLITMLSDPGLPIEDFQRIREYLRISIEDLDSVTHDLNTILHIKGTPKDEFKAIDLRRILNDVLSKLDHEIKSTGMTIEFKGFNDCLVFGVSAFIHSVFYNLLENAIKYRTRASAPILTISCIQEGEVSIIEIADNGIGIDMALAEPKIFGIYQRFSLGPGGRGLGLYMVKTQMEMMGGNVTVKSQLGKGTRFSLTFQNPSNN